MTPRDRIVAIVRAEVERITPAWVTARRCAAGLTRRGLAYELGVSYEIVLRWELGVANPTRFMRLLLRCWARGRGLW